MFLHRGGYPHLKMASTESLSAALAKFDRDGSGVLTRAQLIGILCTPGGPRAFGAAEAEVAADRFIRASGRKDGALRIDEFVKLASKPTTPQRLTQRDFERGRASAAGSAVVASIEPPETMGFASARLSQTLEQQPVLAIGGGSTKAALPPRRLAAIQRETPVHMDAGTMFELERLRQENAALREALEMTSEEWAAWRRAARASVHRTPAARPPAGPLPWRHLPADGPPPRHDGSPSSTGRAQSCRPRGPFLA